MTTKLLDTVFAKADLIGTIKVETDRLVFDTHIRRSSGQVSRSTFIDMGDIVYFMVVDNELMKIGKAAGRQGWYGRMNEYGKARYNEEGKESWDRTTRKIYNYMTKNYDESRREINVYAIKCPRQLTVLSNPLTGDVMTEYIETAGVVEQSLIQLAYKQGYTLDFCREKEKSK